MLVCEAAGYYKTLEMTLYDAMGALYEKYGYYVDGVDSIYMEGLDGLQRMKDLMASLRKNPPKEFGGDKVTSYIDYAIPAEYDLVKGTSEKLPGGTTDALYFRIGTDVIVIRPSGTEPKIKFYSSAPAEDERSRGENRDATNPPRNPRGVTAQFETAGNIKLPKMQGRSLNACNDIQGDPAIALFV